MGFCHQKHLFAVFGEFFEILTDRFFAIAAHIGMGRIPVSDTPFDRLSEQQLAEGNMQTGAKSQYRNLDAGSAKRTGGDNDGVAESRCGFMLKRQHGCRTTRTGGL